MIKVYWWRGLGFGRCRCHRYVTVTIPYLSYFLSMRRGCFSYKKGNHNLPRQARSLTLPVQPSLSTTSRRLASPPSAILHKRSDFAQLTRLGHVGYSQNSIGEVCTYVALLNYCGFCSGSYCAMRTESQSLIPHHGFRPPSSTRGSI